MTELNTLSAGQMLKRVYDDEKTAIKTIPAEDTTFEIAVSALDGDSVLVYGNNLSASSATLTSASSGDAITAQTSTGLKSFQIYAEVLATDTTTAGDIEFRIDVSPVSSGSSYFQTSTTLTIPGGSSTGDMVQSSLLTNILSNRVKVAISSNSLDTGDQVKVHLVGNSL